MPSLASKLETALGVAVTTQRPLSGGCVAKVWLIGLADGRRVVAKEGGDGLDLEGWMLSFLADKLPVPDVLHAAPDLLVMTYLEARSGGLDGLGEGRCARLVAALHGHGGEAFGLDRDTVIGGLPQPNPWTDRWRDFFRDHRLLYMAQRAFNEGVLPKDLLTRIERLAQRLDGWIEEPSSPSLIHGDLWGGNILARPDGAVSFIDPAIYYADPEIELAFGTLFGTFGPEFFRGYEERRQIRDGFFDCRRHLYNLYPLLVHVRLFGASYLEQLETLLDRFQS